MNHNAESGATALPARLRSQTLDDMTDFMRRAGHPDFRAKQLYQWIYEKGAREYADMTNLSKELRAWLLENVALGGVERVRVVGSADETQKLVFQTDDGCLIESVLMRGEDEDEDELEPEEPAGGTAPMKKVSLCVSSQIGCALDCQFCMTGEGGFRRNLRVDEILDQVIHARGMMAPNERIANVVFMGMGEPMLNLDAVIPALRLLTNPTAFNFATRRVTVSTAGVIPGIRTFGEARTDVNLAVSLNATTQEVRDAIMPGCKKWPLESLLEACRHFPLYKRRRVTFEYVLLKNVNDTDADRARLVKMLRGLTCKINLILYNPGTAAPLAPTSESAAEAFREFLTKAHFTASLRRSKGRGLLAACGQLAAHVRGLEQDEAGPSQISADQEEKQP